MGSRQKGEGEKTQVNQSICEFCNKDSDTVFARLEVGGSSFSFCGWSCIFGYTLTQLKDAEDNNLASIADLKKKVEDLELTIAYLRGGLQA